jgi:hypothetical protein
MEELALGGICQVGGGIEVIGMENGGLLQNVGQGAFAGALAGTMVEAGVGTLVGAGVGGVMGGVYYYLYGRRH